MTIKGGKIRVLVVDDTPTARNLIRGIIQEDPAMEIAGMACSGIEAISMLPDLRPDIITMDIYMPGMNGFEATRQIMSTSPVPIVIISSAFHPGETELSFQALEAGALTILPPPRGPGHPDFQKAARKLNTTLKLL